MNKSASIFLLIYCFLFSGCANQSTEITKCRNGFFPARNNGTQLFLTKFCDGESFEIVCSTLSEKANGKCHVKWYINDTLSGELVTEYINGRQPSEVITFRELRKKFPHYTATLRKREWEQFNFEIKTLISFEAARETGNFEHSGARYQFPNQLVKGQTIYDVIDYKEKNRKI